MGRGPREVRLQRPAARGDHPGPRERVRKDDGGHRPRGAAPAGDRQAGTEREAGIQARGVADRGSGGGGQVEDALKRAEGLFAPKKKGEEVPKEEVAGEAPPGPDSDAASAPQHGEGDANVPAAEGTPGEKPEEIPGDGSGA